MVESGSSEFQSHIHPLPKRDTTMTDDEIRAAEHPEDALGGARSGPHLWPVLGLNAQPAPT